MWVRRHIILAACAAIWALAFAPAPAEASHGEAPDAFLRSLTDRALAKVNDPNIGKAERETNFLALLRENFDLPSIGKFVLGKYWRAANPEQREAFIAAFEEAQMRRFLPLFADYTPEMIEIGRVQPDPNNPALVLVSSVIREPGAEPIAVVWRMVDRKAGFKVVDVVAEGISMAISLRQEYGAVARKDGVDGLIAQLRAKNSELAAQ